MSSSPCRRSRGRCPGPSHSRWSPRLLRARPRRRCRGPAAAAPPGRAGRGGAEAALCFRTCRESAARTRGWRRPRGPGDNTKSINNMFCLSMSVCSVKWNLGRGVTFMAVWCGRGEEWDCSNGDTSPRLKYGRRAVTSHIHRSPLHYG